jgi:hypothetical protein
MKTMNKLKNELKENFTQVPNQLIEDPNLSWKAKGIYLYLISKPTDWEFYMNHLKKQSTDGVTALRAGIKELEDAGYLVREKKYDPKTKQILGFKWILPSVQVFRKTGNPSDGKFDSRETYTHTNTDLNNTNITNTYINYVDLWNECHGTKLRITDGKRNQIKARLNKFTEAEIESAIKARGSTKWIKENNQSNNWDAMFKNDNALEHWLLRSDEQSPEQDAWAEKGFSPVGIL